MARVEILLIGLLMAGCSPKVVTRDVPVEVKVAVPQPCATKRPVPPKDMVQRWPDSVWNEMDVRQKSAAAGDWGLRQQEYGQELDAATASCPEVK